MRRVWLRFMTAAVVCLVLMLATAGAALAWPDVGPEDLAAYGLAEGDLEQISQGYPDGSWMPYAAMTRAQFIKMAVEAWDVPLAAPETPTYVDMPKGHQYYGHVEGAAAAGLITGVGGDRFDPAGLITREQAAGIIARWLAATKGYDLTGYLTAAQIEAALAGFVDGGQVATPLREEVPFAVEWGVLRGDAGSRLTPTANLLRIQGAALLLRSAAQAEAEGISADSVVMGIGGATGSFSGDEEDLGFQLAFLAANDAGGVNGRQIVTTSYAGASTTADKVANAKKLVEQDQVFGLLNFGGMPLALALAPYVQEQKVPYLFPHTGAGQIDGQRYIFSSFPYYEDECRYMLNYLVNERGYHKLAIAYADNVYGYLFRDALQAQSEALGYEVVASQVVKDMKPATLATEVAALQDAGPDAVIMALYVEQAQKLLEEKGLAGWEDVQMVSTGPLTDANTLNVAGGYGEGTIGLAFYPDAATSMETGVVEYRTLMAQYHPGKEVNNYSLYGYVYGRLVLAGLEAAGQNLTRERFIDAMETLDDWSSGGIMPDVGFSATDHHAQPWGFVVELRDGKFEPLTDWINVESADMVITNAKVLTVDDDFSVAEAVAVKDGVIRFVGSSGQAARFVGSSTQVLDLGGKVLMPGVNDSHAHATQLGLSLPPLQLDLNSASGVTTLAQVQALVAARVTAVASADEWIRGSGWDPWLFPDVTRYDLDAVAPDNPVALMDMSQHNMWVNSRALQLAGITKDTPDPEGGIIVRDTEGEPTGMLKELSATALIKAAIPPYSDKELGEAAIAAMNIMNAQGVTSMTEAALTTGEAPAPFGKLDVYKTLFDEGKLTVRVNALMLFGEYGAVTFADLKNGVDTFAWEEEIAKPDWLNVEGVKIFADGIPVTYTSWMWEPYVGDHGYGSLTIPGASDDDKYNELIAMIRYVHGKNLRLGVHATGDRAISSVLDGFALAYADHPDFNDTSDYIIHGELIAPADALRAAAMNIGINMQPVIQGMIADIEPGFIGPELAAYEWPFNTCFSAGLNVASSSDTPVTFPNWRQGMQAMITREGYMSGLVSGPQEIVTREQAVRAYTINGAIQDKMEDVKGSIESGKLADFCILDKDIMTVDPHELTDTVVLMTILGGDIVYDGSGGAFAR